MAIKFEGKTVLVTGASSGIGAACAEIFAQYGARLILAARRQERLFDLQKKLEEKFKTETLLLSLDVSKRKEVEEVIAKLPKNWQQIDVLINNAGLALGLDKFQDANIDDWDTMISTNLQGLLYVTRNIIPKMIERNQGHIINIGSVAGHDIYPKGSVYAATKHAVDALTRSMRLDLNGTNIRVTAVDPGMVETEFSIVRFQNNTARAKEVYAGLQPLSAEDVADAVFYCASRPAHVNVSDILLFPTAQAAVDLVHRKSG